MNFTLEVENIFSASQFEPSAGTRTRIPSLAAALLGGIGPRAGHAATELEARARLRHVQPSR
jgi:hypothetical protein